MVQGYENGPKYEPGPPILPEEFVIRRVDLDAYENDRKLRLNANQLREARAAKLRFIDLGNKDDFAGEVYVLLRGTAVGEGRMRGPVCQAVKANGEETGFYFAAYVDNSGIFKPAGNQEQGYFLEPEGLK
jgi:hypothetical protein